MAVLKKAKKASVKKDNVTGKTKTPWESVTVRIIENGFLCSTCGDGVKDWDPIQHFFASKEEVVGFVTGRLDLVK